MKARIITLIILSAVSITTIAGLIYKGERNRNALHGFSRNSIDVKLSPFNYLDVPDKNMKIAGSYLNHYFLSTSNPSIIYGIDVSKNEMTTYPVNLNLGKDSSLLNYAFGIEVHYPEVDIYACNLASIFHYNLLKRNFTVSKTKRNFSRASRIRDHVYFIREFDSMILNQEFVKYDFQNNIRQVQNLSFDNLNDGGISSSGFLKYDLSNHKINFIHFFGHDVLVFDTNMTLSNRINTIDTFTSYHAQISMRTISKTKKNFSYSKPRDIININAAVYGEWVFILTSLKADNQSDINFRDSSAIDIYNCLDGIYQGSFYIPKFNGKQASDFMILDDKMIILYPSKLIIYNYKFNQGVPPAVRR